MYNLKEIQKIKNIKKLIEKKVLSTNNDKYVSNNIMDFLFNKCDKCNNYSKKELTYVFSFNDGIRDYNFKDRTGTKYGLKKFCDYCIYCNASPYKIYVEV